ncbi:MAG: hypothetical protein R3B06_16950 [Kofleriaceae bacterium]
MAYRPSHAAANYAIEIDGKTAGWVKSVGLPKIELEKVESKVGSFVHTAKSGGNYKHSGFDTSYSISETNKVIDWIMSLPRKSVLTTDGAIRQANHNFDAVRRVDWTIGNITEVKLPKLTAAEGKNPFMVDFKWEAETVEWSKDSGKITAEQGTKHKAWNAANWAADGLVGEVEWITEIELPAITAKLGKESYGTQRLPALHYASIDIADIKFKISARSRDSHLDYVKKVIKDGKLSANEYLDLSITMKDPSLTQDLGVLSFLGCGLISYEEDKLEANQDKVATFTLGFSVETFDLKFTHTDA